MHVKVNIWTVGYKQLKEKHAKVYFTRLLEENS